MKDRVFFDTNVLVYAHTDLDTIKQAKAQELIHNSSSFISTQVLQELANTLRKKFNHDWGDISKVLEEASSNNQVFVNTETTIQKSFEIAKRYGFSFYDSLIVAAALSCDASVLFTEDLQDGQIIESHLKIENPFKKNQSR
jgi:predicted nucleic acid-binding protein